MKLAERMSRLGTETAFEVLAKAKALEAQGREVVHLEIGEPDFDTPKHIIDAACEALNSGYTHYTPSAGIPQLRADIAEDTSRTRGIPVEAENVVGTPGGKPIRFFGILALAEPGGFIRLFIDEGLPMAHLLSEAATQGMMPDYTWKLLAVFKAEKQEREDTLPQPAIQPLLEPLSQRELEVLHLIAQGLSNQEISERLFLALDTVKGHNRKIFGKLQVERRTEAVARARELGLL